jgi:uncharacterized membrane protein YadS
MVAGPFGLRAGRALDPLVAGIGASLAVAAGAWLAVQAEAALTGRAWIEGVVAAILIGGAIATFGRARPGWTAGVSFSAKRPLEIAIAPVGGAAVQVGAMVKLARVMMLGPLILVLSLTAGSRAARPPLAKLVPWYILAFAALAAARTAGYLPAPILPPMAVACQVLTIVSMAALGLSTDFRAVLGSGGRVAGAAVASLGVLMALSLVLLALLGRA